MNKKVTKRIIPVIAVLLTVFFGACIYLVVNAALVKAVSSFSTSSAKQSDKPNVTLELKKQFPDIELLSREDTERGYTKYNYRANGIEFTYTDSNLYNRRVSPRHDQWDDYSARLHEKLSDEYLRGNSELLANTVFKTTAEGDYLFKYSLSIDSYDEIDGCIPVFREIYRIFYDHLPETEIEDDSAVFCAPPSLMFGIYCPTETVYDRDIFTYPENERYGYIYYYLKAVKDNEPDWEHALDILREEYRQGINAGHITDPVLTPDEPLDTEIEFYNNHYITACAVDGKPLDLPYENDFLFKYDESRGKYYAEVFVYDLSRYNRWYTEKSGLTAEEDILYSFYKAVFPDGEMTVSSGGSRFDYSINGREYSFFSFGASSGKKTAMLSKPGETVPLDSYFEVGSRIGRDVYYISIDDLADMFEMDIAQINEESRTVYFETRGRNGQT